uniref:Protein tyrosine phosphatase mitochondrial 1 n=1 Tax=Oncorhynchus tshawytscha TaxID=74940 RepID=A0AAZ3P3H4_ONCTS
MSGALARVLFYPTLAYNVVMEKVSSRRWFNRVDQTVILGALPFKSMTKELVQTENVRGVITMNEEYETKYFCNSAEIHCWSPEEACQMLASVRPHVIIRSSQLEMLRRYHQQVCGGGSI